MPKVYAEPKEDVMKDCLATGGTDDFHTMPDGWKLHSETFMPPGEPKAMIVHTPGWMESTVTVGVRRLAKQCSERGIVLVTYDMHGHGLSLEKNGVAWTTEAKRGKIEGVQGVIDTHLVEIVKIFLERHKLPLMLLGHSLGAQAAMLATRQVVELCRAAGVPYVTGAYLAPHVQATPPCCCGCCTTLVCGACCCGCGDCCKMGKNQAEEGKNPGGVLTGGKIEEDRNATSVLFYNMFSTGVCLPSSAGGTASWARYTPEIDVGVPGRVFVGDKDPNWGMWKHEIVPGKSKLPTSISFFQLPSGTGHECLNEDPKSMEVVGLIFKYFDEMLAGGTGTTTLAPNDMERGA